MLLTVEGGGFFSSSASGYSKGLTLLLLGQKTEDKPMKVTPWNHHPLEEERGSESEIQLASAPGNKGLVRGCASFSCFGCAATGLESPSAQKAGPAKTEEIVREPTLHDDEGKDQTRTVNHVHDDEIESEGKMAGVDSNMSIPINGGPVDSIDGSTGDGIDNSVGAAEGNKVMLSLNQSLNKSESEDSALVAENGEGCRNINENGTLREKDGSTLTCQVQRRKVQWMDTIGGELFEIREFEMSDDSDDEFGHGNGKCMCRIM